MTGTKLFKAIAMLSVPLLLVVSGRSIEQNETKGLQAEITEVDPLDGAALYQSYCASCHGLNARGNGPAVSALRKRPPDLTRINERAGGIFDTVAVENTISGDAPNMAAHGSREMPIWGPVFRRIDRDRDFGNVRIHNLAKYLESLQKK